MHQFQTLRSATSFTYQVRVILDIHLLRFKGVPVWYGNSHLTTFMKTFNVAGNLWRYLNDPKVPVNKPLKSFRIMYASSNFIRLLYLLINTDYDIFGTCILLLQLPNFFLSSILQGEKFYIKRKVECGIDQGNEKYGKWGNESVLHFKWLRRLSLIRYIIGNLESRWHSGALRRAWKRTTYQRKGIFATLRTIWRSWEADGEIFWELYWHFIRASTWGGQMRKVFEKFVKSTFRSFDDPQCWRSVVWGYWKGSIKAETRQVVIIDIHKYCYMDQNFDMRARSRSARFLVSTGLQNVEVNAMVSWRNST